MCQKLTYLNKFMKSKTSFFNSKVFARYNYYRKSLLEMIRLYLYDCSVYLVTALISIGLTTLILRTYLPLFVLRNGSLYAIIRTCSYICTSCLSYIHLCTSMTSLLADTVAQPTKWRFLLKNLNQLVIFVIGLALT